MPRSVINNLPGTYALIFHCAAPFCVRIGKLGLVEGPKGYWIYVGNAFGPGGLASRLTHHLKPSHRPHWHLDYLVRRPISARQSFSELGSPHGSVMGMRSEGLTSPGPLPTVHAVAATAAYVIR